MAASANLCKTPTLRFVLMPSSPRGKQTGMPHRPVAGNGHSLQFKVSRLISPAFHQSRRTVRASPDRERMSIWLVEKHREPRCVGSYETSQCDPTMFSPRACLNIYTPYHPQGGGWRTTSFGGARETVYLPRTFIHRGRSLEAETIVREHTFFRRFQRASNRKIRHQICEVRPAISIMKWCFGR